MYMFPIIVKHNTTYKSTSHQVSACYEQSSALLFYNHSIQTFDGILIIKTNQMH